MNRLGYNAIARDWELPELRFSPASGNSWTFSFAICKRLPGFLIWVVGCVMHITYISWPMRFKHDPAKAKANLKKHGVSFADAEGALEDPLAVNAEDPDAKGTKTL